MNIYYVYAYLRNKDSDTAKAGTPYYIGKGKNNRVRASHGKVPIPKDESDIIFIKEGLSNQDASSLETELIAKYGRKDVKTGILLNRTDGGDGVPGAVLPKTKEHKRKIGLANKGKTRTREQKEHLSQCNKGKKRTPESVAKGVNTRTALNLKTVHSEETRRKISRACVGKKKPHSKAHVEARASARRGKPQTKQVTRLSDKKEMSLSHYVQWLNRLQDQSP